jgi:hypothetical protein
MDNFYFVSVSLVTAFAVTAVPIRYYLKVTEPLDRDKWLFKLRDKLKVMPFLAVAGAISFCTFLSQNNESAVYLSLMVIALSFIISMVSAMATLTIPQCRVEGKNTAEFKILRFFATATWKLAKMLAKLDGGAAIRTDKDSYSSPSLEGYDSYQRNFDRDLSMGRIDSYGRFKD